MILLLIIIMKVIFTILVMIMIIIISIISVSRSMPPPRVPSPKPETVPNSAIPENKPSMFRKQRADSFFQMSPPNPHSHSPKNLEGGI
jgi:hypothetical protein